MTILSDSLAIVKRNITRLRRTPQLFVFSSIQPIMFLLLFNYVFGGAVTRSGTGTDSYINFLLPGILAQTAIFGSMQTGVGMADDLTKGAIDRFRSLPMSRGAIVIGRTLADAFRNIWVVAIMLAIGETIGFRFHHGLGAGVAALAIAVVFGFAFSWISLVIGLLVKDPESVQTAGFLWVFPLVFASSVFVPTATMPAWLQGFAENQPITQTVNAVRFLTQGVGSAASVGHALLWAASIIVVFLPLSVAIYRRTV